MIAKVPRTKEELERQLQDQLYFLEKSATDFDNGIEIESKRLATQIRILVHDTKNSQSLLSQIGLKGSLKYLDMSFPYEPRSKATYNGLILAAFEKDLQKGKWSAPLDEVPPDQIRRVEFSPWWNGIAFKDKNERLLTRRDVILTVADKDGGAHVDPELDEPYVDLSQNNSLGTSYGIQGREVPMGDPIPATVRQIAHELLKALKPSYTKERMRIPNEAIAIGQAYVVEKMPSSPPVPTVGRNEKCPCGSGKKYKHCHGRPAQIP